MELALSPSIISPPRPARSLLTLNMDLRRVPRQPVPHLHLTPTEEVEFEPTSHSIRSFTPHSPFTPASVSPFYLSTSITRPRLTWTEERALRESLETAFVGLDLRAQSFVEGAPLLQDLRAHAQRQRSRSRSRSRLEVEEHARRREGTGRGRPRRGSTASARGRGTALKSLRGASAVDSSRRRERN
jgi:hypothetical protein